MKFQLKPQSCGSFILIIGTLFIVVCFLVSGCSNKEGQFVIGGQRYLDVDRVDLAIGEFNRALELNPSSYPAYCGRARAYTKVRNYEKAFLDLNQAIKIDSNLPDAYYYRAQIYYKKNQFQEALIDLNQSIAIDSDHPEQFWFRGTIYTRSRQFDLALADFSECIRLHRDLIMLEGPSPSGAYVGRAIVFLEIRQHDNAIKDLKEAIRIDPNNAQAFWVGSIVREDQEDIAKAVENMERYMELKPLDNKGKDRLNRLKSQLLKSN